MMNFYHKLLDLPETETPPDHYGLLGVSRFTDDAKQIHAALVTRNTQLRGWDNSKFYREANALLDEVVAASFILEDPLKKAVYDAELRERLGLPETKPVAIVARPEVVEGQPATESSTRRIESSLPERSARPTKQPEAIRAERDDEPTDAAADAPETSYDSLYLKLGGGLIAVTLLIAVSVVMWAGRKSEPVARPIQTAATADTLKTPQPAPDPDWDPVNFRELVTFAGHTSPVMSVAFSPDGKRLASTSFETVNIWDATSGQQMLTLKGHTARVRSVAFSPDGKLLASAGGYIENGDKADNTVKVWDVASGEHSLTLTGHTGEVTSVAFSPDGKRLVSGSHVPNRTNPPGTFSYNSVDPGELKVWDTTTGQETLALREHIGGVMSVAFSPDGKRLASAGDTTVKMWDATSGQQTLTLKGHIGGVTSVGFSPDGKRLASASRDLTVKVWDATSGQETRTLNGHTTYVTSVAFSPDGRRLASASGIYGTPGEVKVWDATSGQEILTLKGDTANSVANVAFSPDGTRLVSVDGSINDRAVKVWDSTSGEMLLTLKGYTGSVMIATFSPDGKRLATVSDDGTLKLWDSASGQVILTLKAHTNSIQSVSFSPDGKRLATASYDQTVKIWGADLTKAGPSGSPDAPNPKPVPEELITLTGHARAVMSVAYSPDGKRLASASEDSTVIVWDATSGQQRRTLKGHTSRVNSVVFSADGKWLTTAGADYTVKLWNAWTGQETRTLKGHKNRVTSVALSPDGKRLASASEDATVEVWDATSGQKTLTLRGYSGHGFTSVAFSPDGKRLAAASDNRFVWMWDATTGEEGRTLDKHTNGVNSVAFSADGSGWPRLARTRR